MAITDRDISAVLRAARAIIADRSRWTQGTFARNLLDFPCAPESPDAVRWCAMGAISAATCRIAVQEGNTVTIAGLVFAVEKALGCGERSRVSMTNDYRGHDAVLTLFDQALDRLAADAGPPTPDHCQVEEEELVGA